MKCENCGNNPIKTKPSATQLESWMVPTGPWLPPLRWITIIGIIAAMLFYIMIEPQTGLNIYYGFVPLFFSVIALSFVNNILIFSRVPFLCKICGHTQQPRELQKLSQSCRQCEGRQFIRTWSYPFWVKIAAILLAVSSVAAPALLVVSLATISPIFIYLAAAIGGIWLISFGIIETRSAIYNRILFKGSDMIRILRCAGCGERQ